MCEATPDGSQQAHSMVGLKGDGLSPCLIAPRGSAGLAAVPIASSPLADGFRNLVSTVLLARGYTPP